MSRNQAGSKKMSPKVGTKSKSNYLQDSSDREDKRLLSPSSTTDSSKHNVPSKMKVPLSPTKKLSRTISKGELSASDALKILQKMKQEQEKALDEMERKKHIKNGDPIDSNPIPSDEETESVVDEAVDDTNNQEDTASCAGDMTKEQIERENKKLRKAEKDLDELRIKMEEKEIIFHKLLLELKRMSYIFNKVKEIDIRTAGKEFEKEESKVISCYFTL